MHDCGNKRSVGSSIGFPRVPLSASSFLGTCAFEGFLCITKVEVIMGLLEKCGYLRANVLFVWGSLAALKGKNLGLLGTGGCFARARVVLLKVKELAWERSRVF